MPGQRARVFGREFKEAAVRRMLQGEKVRALAEEPIADGVGQRGLPDVVVPLGRGELAGDDRGAAAIAVLENLEQVAALLVLRGGQAPVVDEEDVHARELAEESAVGAVG